MFGLSLGVKRFKVPQSQIKDLFERAKLIILFLLWQSIMLMKIILYSSLALGKCHGGIINICQQNI